MSALGDPEFDTVILAGGEAARMDGADKPALEVGGEPMVVLVARAAAAARTARLVVVGPQRGGQVGRALAAAAVSVPGGLLVVCEDPPGSGPVAALRRGLAEVTAPWIALLAADLPFLTAPWLTTLLSLAVSESRPGAMLIDDDDRPQWLAGCWQAGLLREALAGYRGQSLGGVLAPLRAAELRPRAGCPATSAPWLDCDSPADLAAARATVRTRNGES